MIERGAGESNGESMSAEQLLEQRVIEPDQFVADTEAFVDVRIERSKGKASYSFVGPGVSQNTNQMVNLTLPHGFQIGAATMPHGVVNNPHLHFTAEVFVCTRGSFRITIGAESDQAVDIGPGTVFSAPTWVFRGFSNTGPDDGWLFAVLGGDDTGGIIWAPEILAEAAATGLYLDRDYAVLDATAGDDISEAIEPFKPAQLSSIDSYTDAELAERAVATDDLTWSDSALLSSVLEQHRSAVAPVIGYGLTEDRSHRAPITVPHGFSLEWLRLEPGSSVGRHRHADSQVLLLTEGQWQVELWAGDHSAVAEPETGSVVSIPPNCWRDLKNIGDTVALAVVVCNGDNPTAIEWTSDIVSAAADAGVARDASGYLAPVELIGRPADHEQAAASQHTRPEYQQPQERTQ
jgi:quercetin dioxygenase-like cupin family protein